jgi:hypothetical protein
MTVVYCLSWSSWFIAGKPLNPLGCGAKLTRLRFTELAALRMTAPVVKS